MGVLGAGAIGCYVGARLGQASSVQVTFVGRPRLQAELVAAGGIRAITLQGEEARLASPSFVIEPGPLAAVDVVLVCVKSRHTAAAARELRQALLASPSASPLVVSLQNGVRNSAVLREELPSLRVLPGVVGFNVVAQGGGVFRHATQGPIQIEAAPEAERLVAALRATGLEVELHDELLPRQWTKLVVNLNNAISALSDASIRDMILDRDYRRLVAQVVGEGVSVLRSARVPTSSFQGVPLGLFPHLLRLPTPLVRWVAARRLHLDPEARSSMWQDLHQGRPTEVDHLNGEIVRIAREHGLSAPLNRRLVDLVHAAERSGSGPPALSASALALALRSDPADA